MKKERDKTGTFLIEGYHLVEEALKNKEQIKQLIISEEVDLPATWNTDNILITVVSKEVMAAISDTETPQGVAAKCKQLGSSEINDDHGMFLFIDAVQDPGNLGTIIRTADAAGIDAIIVGEGSADVYNSKVIRATQGALFHLPIIKGNLFEWVSRLQASQIPIYGTALENAVSYKEVKPTSSFAIIVGNEGGGMNKELLAKTSQNLYIPIFGKSESLNVAVAAGILLYYFRR